MALSVLESNSILTIAPPLTVAVAACFYGLAETEVFDVTEKLGLAIHCDADKYHPFLIDTVGQCILAALTLVFGVHSHNDAVLGLV